MPWKHYIRTHERFEDAKPAGIRWGDGGNGGRHFVCSCPQWILGVDLKKTGPWQSWDTVLEKSGSRSRTGPWLRPSLSFHCWILQDKTQLTVSWRQTSRFDHVSGHVQNHRHLPNFTSIKVGLCRCLRVYGVFYFLDTLRMQALIFRL